MGHTNRFLTKETILRYRWNRFLFAVKLIWMKTISNKSTVVEFINNQSCLVILAKGDKTVTMSLSTLKDIAQSFL